MPARSDASYEIKLSPYDQEMDAHNGGSDGAASAGDASPVSKRPSTRCGAVSRSRSRSNASRRRSASVTPTVRLSRASSADAGASGGAWDFPYMPRVRPRYDEHVLHQPVLPLASSKGKKDEVYTDGLVPSWNDFVCLYNADAALFIDHLRKYRERNETYSLTHRNRWVDDASYDAGFDCAVPNDVDYWSCAPSDPRMTGIDVDDPRVELPEVVRRASQALRRATAGRHLTTAAARPLARSARGARTRLVLNDHAPSTAVAQAPIGTRAHEGGRTQTQDLSRPRATGSATPRLMTLEGNLSNELDSDDLLAQGYDHRHRDDRGEPRRSSAYSRRSPSEKAARASHGYADQSEPSDVGGLRSKLRGLQQLVDSLSARHETLVHDYRSLLADLRYSGIDRGLRAESIVTLEASLGGLCLRQDAERLDVVDAFIQGRQAAAGASSYFARAPSAFTEPHERLGGLSCARSQEQAPNGSRSLEHHAHHCARLRLARSSAFCSRHSHSDLNSWRLDIPFAAMCVARMIFSSVTRPRHARHSATTCVVGTWLFDTRSILAHVGAAAQHPDVWKLNTGG
ncbi:hypothetical protein PybrP1_003789 [[Pythium] brassicae (nom. inval.)]|nr:hypothetical protein PybrP1_003789 [[Pythium] brassicae (nom. inval.)]